MSARPKGNRPPFCRGQLAWSQVALCPCCRPAGPWWLLQSTVVGNGAVLCMAQCAVCPQLKEHTPGFSSENLELKSETIPARGR